MKDLKYIEDKPNSKGLNQAQGEYAYFGTTSNFAQIGLEQSLHKMGAIFS
jgi:hypothetical protein